MQEMPIYAGQFTKRGTERKHWYMRKKIFAVLAAVWMAVIFAYSSRNAELSTQDSTSIGRFLAEVFVPGFNEMDLESQIAFANKIDHPIRKMAHMAEYAVLGFFLAGSWLDADRKKLVSVSVPWAIGALYAVSDELHQKFVPGRSCQATDVLIDSCGVLIGVLASYAIITFALAYRKKHGR